jgi:ABC-type Mn2+/Zn2+ transport system ATPase subunit
LSDALRLRSVCVVVGGRRVLDEVSFEVGRGEFCCLCGPNGGGKTTLLKATLGLVPLASGTIEVLGRPPGQSRREVGYLPQAKGFNPGFPARVIEMILANHRGVWPLRIRPADRERARAALARVGGERLLEAPLRGLSGGEMQRAFLARAVVNEPALLLLDEPTAGVDAQGRGEFLDLLARVAARDDLAAVLVTHNAAAARRLASRVVYLDGRVLAWGSPAEVLDREWTKRGHGADEPESPHSLLCEDDG